MAKRSFRWAWVGACLLGACASGAASDRSTSTSQAAPAAAPAEGASPQAAAQPATSATAVAARGAPAESTTGTIEGRAELERGNELWIGGSEDEGRAFEPFRVDDRTAVTIDGQKATMAQVNAGDEVRASYSGTGADLHVDRLEVRTAGAPQQGQR